MNICCLGSHNQRRSVEVIDGAFVYWWGVVSSAKNCFVSVDWCFNGNNVVSVDLANYGESVSVNECALLREPVSEGLGVVPRIPTIIGDSGELWRIPTIIG